MKVASGGRGGLGNISVSPHVDQDNFQTPIFKLRNIKGENIN